jgi:hypothetical protein
MTPIFPHKVANLFCGYRALETWEAAPALGKINSAIGQGPRRTWTYKFQQLPRKKKIYQTQQSIARPLIVLMLDTSFRALFVLFIRFLMNDSYKV